MTTAMVQGLYDRLSNGTNLKHFRHASDTTGTRKAGYVVYVTEQNGVYYVHSGYGRLGTNYRETHVGSFGGLANAIQKANDVIRAKLNKNYVEDTHLLNLPSLRAATETTPERTMPSTIQTKGYDIPDRVELPLAQELLDDEGFHFEWYPNRMRMNYILIHSNYYALYSISGIHGREDKLPAEFSPTEEFKKMARDGLLFLGYEDPNGNVVLLRYLRTNITQSTLHGYTYQKQRIVMEMVLQELAGKDIDITDINLPLYMNPSYTTLSLKEDMVRKARGRQGINSFANNLAMFGQTDKMEQIACIER